MSKKVKLIVGLLCMVIVMCICTTVFVLYAMKQKAQELEIAKSAQKEIESELKEEKEKLRKTKHDVEIAYDTLADTEEELKQMTRKFNKVKDLYKEASSEETVSEEVSTPEPTPAPTEVPVSAPTSTPEETPMYTEFDDGKCYMDIAGNFAEPGFGRVQIRVSPHDAGAPDDYVVNITGSNGAADSASWSLTGNWNASTSSLDYHGNRMDTINGVSTSYEGITGSLRFDGPNTLYWTDPGTENYDRGPFTKQ